MREPRSVLSPFRSMAGMGTAIRVHKKTVAIMGILAGALILWMVFGHIKTTRRFSYKAGIRSNPNGLQVMESYNEDEPGSFSLEGKRFTILSGAMHYFRIPNEYWEDRLRKLKYMGLNTVETYVSWNLHEESPGHYNFEGDLNIEKFVKTAKDLDLYVIIRPGPYICAEWDLGGLPSWLLRNQDIQLRSLDPKFLLPALKFLDKLISKLTKYQYSQGGPIIAWQVENEYLSYDNKSAYVWRLKEEMIKSGVTELIFTSDGIWQMEDQKNYTLPEVLKTVNFQRNEKTFLPRLLKLQPHLPLMVTEFWSGWFDHWGEDRHVLAVDKATKRVENILDLKSSINFYMLHGGTNFGFMNGANAQKGKYKPTTTSYDYDAPISEAGDMTPKYDSLREAILKHAPDSVPTLMASEKPQNTKKGKYEPIEIQHFLKMEKMLEFVDPIENDIPVHMELLPINNNGGQGYGFILYETFVPKTAKKLKISSYRDRAQVFFNSQPVDIPDPMLVKEKYLDEKLTKDVSVSLPADEEKDKNKLQILVENMGRVNFLQEINSQRKGILGDVFIDGKKHKSWKMYPLEFKSPFVTKVTNKAEWDKISEDHHPGIGLYKGVFNLDEEPKDTFMNMKGWTKGVVFVNGRNLGRYWEIGPQHTLYLPKPWLKKGENTVVIFEQEGTKGNMEVQFEMEPILGSTLLDRE